MQAKTEQDQCSGLLHERKRKIMNFIRFKDKIKNYWNSVVLFFIFTSINKINTLFIHILFLVNFPLENIVVFFEKIKRKKYKKQLFFSILYLE